MANRANRSHPHPAGAYWPVPPTAREYAYLDHLVEDDSACEALSDNPYLDNPLDTTIPADLLTGAAR